MNKFDNMIIHEIRLGPTKEDSKTYKYKERKTDSLSNHLEEETKIQLNIFANKDRENCFYFSIHVDAIKDLKEDYFQALSIPILKDKSYLYHNEYDEMIMKDKNDIILFLAALEKELNINIKLYELIREMQLIISLEETFETKEDLYNFAFNLFDRINNRINNDFYRSLFN
jgi:uncharacterized protein VirK/YbjX